MNPFATWRARLPASIGSWFARDLTRTALALADTGRVTLRAVDDNRIEATVGLPVPINVTVEWSSGTGPQALRGVCGCGGSGVCEHIVATLEAVRLHGDGLQGEPESDDDDFGWLPQLRLDAPRTRARSVWPVISTDGKTLIGTLYLDTPRLRGVMRDAQSIAAMLESTPADDWDDADRELVRDEAILEAFAARSLGANQHVGRALSRALFRLGRHPRLRFDDAPSANRHPSALPIFAVDVRGVRLRAVGSKGHFVPMLEDADGARFSPASGWLLEGPPSWFGTSHGAYLLDGTFDAKRVIEAAASGTAVNGTTPNGKVPSARTIARVAPFLPPEERATLGVVDAERPKIKAVLSWRDGALVARCTLVDEATSAQVVYSSFGGVAEVEGRFIRFGAHVASTLVRPFVEAGFVPRGSDAFALHGPERAATFVREALPAWDLEYELDSALDALTADRSPLDFRVAALRSGERPDWFELSVDVFVGEGEPLTQKELQALLDTTGRYAEIRGKLVDVGKLRAREALLTDLADRKRTGFAALLALRDELHESFQGVSLPPEVERLRERLREFSGIEAIEPPDNLGDVLRDYQRRGLDFLAYLAGFGFGGILADDMGLGKTITTLAYFKWRKKTEGPAPSLVVAPTSVTHTWENEIARFAPDLTTLRLQSGADRAQKFETMKDFDVIITSYALARLDAETLSKHRFRTLVLDEAQNAKNPSSQIAKVVRGLQADHRIALTGTPVENSLRDLWAIFSFLEPGLLGSEGSFRRRFEVPIADGDDRAVTALRSRLEPFVLRRTKEDVARELPERTEVLLECDLTPTQLRMYRAIAEAARRDVLSQIGPNGMEGAAVHVLAALTRLRQVCAHPALLVDSYGDEAEVSGKFDAFLETIDEILSGNHRVLVFSAFASMLRLMRRHFEKTGLEFGYLDGATKDRDRRDEVERFMQPDGPPVFLCSLKAGGVGLTLTAADYVILYDPWWNPAIERQAIDRTHRIGQHRAVTAYRLVTRGTVEEKIRALAERKASLSKTVVKTDSAVAKSLTREDLEQLFADPQT
jgi:superfamily II DNA or RNA helicase